MSKMIPKWLFFRKMNLERSKFNGGIGKEGGGGVLLSAQKNCQVLRRVLDIIGRVQILDVLGKPGV